MSDAIEDSLVRQDFPVTKKTVYFNNGAVAPTPLSTIKAVTDFLLKVSVEGPDCEQTSQYIEGVVSEVRERVAYLLNCQKDEVILVQSTTDGLNRVARGIEWKEGDSIVVRAGAREHHANYFPWLDVATTRGLSMRTVSADQHGFFGMSDLDKAAKGVKLIAMSHVLYNTGAIMPVAEVGKIARENDALFCLDGAQSVGAIPVDVRRISCDFLAFPGFKWLVGPLGIGVLYCSRRARDRLLPTAVGGESAVLDPEQNILAYSEPPARYQAGFRNYPGAAGLEASLRYVLRLGVENIQKKSARVSEAIREGVERLPGAKLHSPEDPSTRSSILTFSLPVESATVVKRLEECGVVLAEREVTVEDKPLKAIRASPHFYNSEDEASQLQSHLKSILS